MNNFIKITIDRIRRKHLFVKPVVSKRFKIIHFPLSEKFYPQFDGYWLKKMYATGIIIKEDYFPVADGFRTEKEALKFIEIFKEQYLMENVKVIDVP
jgi:hypothetical protein